LNVSSKKGPDQAQLLFALFARSNRFLEAALQALHVNLRGFSVPFMFLIFDLLFFVSNAPFEQS
jgi:hypothetical protein